MLLSCFVIVVVVVVVAAAAATAVAVDVVVAVIVAAAAAASAPAAVGIVIPKVVLKADVRLYLYVFRVLSPIDRLLSVQQEHIPSPTTSDLQQRQQ